MNKYIVLQLGDKTEFETEQAKIDKLLSAGYKIVSEIEASSIGYARYKYEKYDSKQTNQKNTDSGSTELKNPSGYLKVTSTLFFVLSIIGCVVLVSLGVDAGDSYDNRSYAGIYYASAFVSFLVAILIHSICKVLIFIADNAKSE